MKKPPYIERSDYIKHVKKALNRAVVVALLGPRQSGKTTLARMIAGEMDSTYFDLESTADNMRLQNPEYVLGGLQGLVVIDEIQTRPDLFALLRVLADRPEQKARFLILGSAAPALIKNASESLAGRIEFVDLHGFDLSEVGPDNWEMLWLRGGFPRSYLAANEGDSMAWREGLIQTCLQRDLPELGIRIPSPAIRRFWTMLAHYHGKTWNASELGRSLGVSDKTVCGYLDVLTETFMVRQLQPWHVNVGKRQVKAPKIYLRDTGLLHALLRLTDRNALLGHPMAGFSWEGFAMEQIMRMAGNPQDAYYWATYGGAELDLLMLRNGQWYGVEFKFSDAPSVTRSMRVAMEDLKLKKLWIIAPAASSYALAPGIDVCTLNDWRQTYAACGAE